MARLCSCPPGRSSLTLPAQPLALMGSRHQVVRNRISPHSGRSLTADRPFPAKLRPLQPLSGTVRELTAVGKTNGLVSGTRIFFIKTQRQTNWPPASLYTSHVQRIGQVGAPDRRGTVPQLHLSEATGDTAATIARTTMTLFLKHVATRRILQRRVLGTAH